MNSPDSDARSKQSELIHRLKEGDGIAWEEFEKAYSKMIRAVLKMWNVSSNEVTNQEQEVKLKFFMELQKGYSVSSIGGLLRRMARNAGVDFHRKPNEIEAEGGTNAQEHAQSIPGKVSSATEELAVWKLVLAKLTEEDYKMLALILLGFEYKEIAEILGYSEGVYYAKRKRLMNLIEGSSQ